MEVVLEMFWARQENIISRTTLGRMEKGCENLYALVKSIRYKGKLNKKKLFAAMKGEGNLTYISCT